MIRRLGMALVATTSALVLASFAAGYATHLDRPFPTSTHTESAP